MTEMTNFEPLSKQIREYSRNIDKLFEQKTYNHKYFRREYSRVLRGLIKNFDNKIQCLYLGIANRVIGNISLLNIDYEKIVEGCICRTYTECSKKKFQKNFYRQNVIAFITACRIILEPFQKNKINKFDQLTIYHAVKSLYELCIDSLYLLQQMNNIFSDKKIFIIGKNPFQDSFCMWQSTRQVLYSAGSGNCFIDKEYAGSVIGMIRISLENRIRSAFSCYGVLDKKDNFSPLNLSKIWQFIAPYQNDIKFAVPQKNIERINKWTNLYMHSGIKDYAWLPHVVIRYLHPLFVGKENSVNSGIQIKNGTLQNLWNDINTQLYPSKLETFGIMDEKKVKAQII